jgi:F-type H+-transporting ATPase subunit gamma
MHAPRLNLAPADFSRQLLDHYLPAALQGVLYESLTAENHLRLQHMDHALDRLDETLTRLNIRRSALRQERIVEEIEVILASASALGEPSSASNV